MMSACTSPACAMCRLGQQHESSELDMFRALESISPTFVFSPVERKPTRRAKEPMRRVPGRNAIGLSSLILSNSDDDDDDDEIDEIDELNDDENFNVPLTRTEPTAPEKNEKNRKNRVFSIVNVGEPVHQGVNLAAREVDSSKDFPNARAELQLNTHGSFFNSPPTDVSDMPLLSSATSPVKRPVWRSIPELLAAPSADVLASPAPAAPAVAFSHHQTPQTPQTPFVGLLASAGVGGGDAADDDTASLLLTEWRKRAAVANAERVAQASQRANEDQLELRRQSLLRQDEALRRAQQTLAKSVSDAAARERSDRQRIDAQRAADLAAAEAVARQAESIAAAAQAKIDAAARAEAARLQAEVEAKRRAEAEAKAKADAAAAAKLKAEADAAAAAAKLKADADAAAANAAAVKPTTTTTTTTTSSAAVSTSTTQTTSDGLKMPNGRSCLATPEALELYARCLKHVETMQTLAAKCEADPMWPEAKKQYDKHINQKINAITLDRDHAKRLVVALLSVIAETAKQDKRAHTVYCLVSIAKKLVQRAPQLKGTTAEVFPVADVAALLMAQVAGLRDLLLGFLFLECPYAAPIFPLRDTRESDEEFLEHGLHYRRGLDGALETESDYKLRQIDYIVLFAAICRAGDSERFADSAAVVDARAWSKSAAQQKSVGIAWAWVWLARMLNSKPRRISLVLLESFLQICGHDLARAYPRQFAKMIQYFATQYAPLLPKDVDTDAKSRLQSLLVDEKCVRPPVGANY
jgi:hypothetical protein